MSQPSRILSVRRFWKPAAVTSAGGAAAAVWFEEILLFAEEFLAIIFLPVLAGAIYLLNLYIFKSRMPKNEDLKDPTLRRGKT